MSEHPVVWIINHYAQEPGGAGGTRHFSLAKQLKAHGFLPYIIAASTVHNQQAQRLGEEETCRIDWHEDIPFLWLKTAAYEGNGIKRLMNMMQFAYRLFDKTLARTIPKPDIVIGSTPDPFAALGAERIAARYKAPFICEVRDFWPISLIELGKMSRFHPLALLMFAIERWLYKRARRIIVVQQRSDLYLTPLGVPHEKLLYLPNGIDTALFPDPAPAPRRQDFTFMYFGAHGNGNALDNVLYAMKQVEAMADTAHIKLRLIGDGPLKPVLQNLAHSLGLKQVSFEAPVAKRDIPKLAAQADAFLFNVVDMPILRYGISANKLFDYLAAKRPVIFACNAVNNPVSEAKAGYTVPAGDAKRLADAMLQLSRLPYEERLEMGDNGRHFVTGTHGFEALGAKLASALDSLPGRA